MSRSLSRILLHLVFSTKDRAGPNRLYLGEGVNGMARYVREEAEAYSAQRLVRRTV